MRSARGGAPWVRKFGYPCIPKILVLRKSSVRAPTPSCKPGEILHFKYPSVSAVNRIAIRTNFNVYIDMDKRERATAEGKKKNKTRETNFVRRK